MRERERDREKERKIDREAGLPPHTHILDAVGPPVQLALEVLGHPHQNGRDERGRGFGGGQFLDDNRPRSFLSTSRQGKTAIWAKFHLFSTYFLPMVPHPCYKLKHGTHLLFFRPHVYSFCLFSTYFLPNLQPIFHRSCLAGIGQLIDLAVHDDNS